MSLSGARSHIPAGATGFGSVFSRLVKTLVFFKKPSWEESPPSILLKKAVTCFERKEIGRLVHPVCVCASRDFPVKVSRVKESGRQHLPAPHRRVLPLLRPVRLRVIRGMDQ